MKVARFVLKIVALALAAAAVTCAVIAYWDKLVEGVQALSEKLSAKKARLCPSEYDDYVE